MSFSGPRDVGSLGPIAETTNSPRFLGNFAAAGPLSSRQLFDL
jgi:hypothetical protein